MLIVILFFPLLISATAVYCFRTYCDSNGKKSFFSGLVGLILFPILLIGGMFSITNIQNIHGDLGGFTVILVIWFVCVIYSTYSLGKYIIQRRGGVKKD